MRVIYDMMGRKDVREIGSLLRCLRIFFFFLRRNLENEREKFGKYRNI